MDKTERSERIWRCTCGGGHFVAISRHYWQLDEDSDDPWQWFGIETYSPNGDSLWSRLKDAWRVLCGTDHETVWAEIQLDTVTAREIAAELLKAADDHEAWQQRREARG